MLSNPSGYSIVTDERIYNPEVLVVWHLVVLKSAVQGRKH
jgi:hypothetical protein